MISYLPELLLFMAAILLLALYGLTVSGHFPAEHRAAQLRTAGGSALMWGSVGAATLATGIALAFAWKLLPWYAAVIAGGGMLLIAPLLLQPFPDTFVNGRRGLLVFAGAAALIAAGMLVQIA